MNPQTKLKPEESIIILHCPQCCQTNCSAITNVNSELYSSSSTDTSRCQVSQVVNHFSKCQWS